MNRTHNQKKIYQCMKLTMPQVNQPLNQPQLNEPLMNQPQLNEPLMNQPQLNEPQINHSHSQYHKNNNPQLHNQLPAYQQSQDAQPQKQLALDQLQQNLKPVNLQPQHEQVNNSNEKNKIYMLTSKQINNWITEYFWVDISLTGTVKCTICSEYFPRDSNRFVQGFRTDKKSHLHDHEICILHKESLKKRLLKNKNLLNIENNQLVARYIEEDDEAIFPIFNNILYLAEQNDAMVKIESLNEIVSLNPKSTLSEHYRNKLLVKKY